MLCDSNILIYAADPHDTRCAQFVERDDATIASVSRIEVLGFPGFANLSPDQQQRLREMIASMIELQLDQPVIERAIVVRQQRRTTLADAVIAATALVHGHPLVTRNTADFQHIDGLRLINPFDNESR
ncbi:MAG: type II toxin-antitoxin system VapC family toxin [Phycisphaerales bacterium]|nr:type II toxin-antitoxin system VapC family toxin [Phycisphaerales bacterium]